MEYLNKLQSVLDFENTKLGVQFKTKLSIGRIGLIGFILGLILGFHFLLTLICLFSTSYENLRIYVGVWSVYIVGLTSFHFLEFIITALYQPKNLCYDSYIVNHSREYTAAVLLSWFEYWIECLLFGRKKISIIICLIGVIIAIISQSIRVLGMKTCGESFSHIIVTEKPSHHELISHGIYRYLRHPAYFGWFYWSVSTQIILCNPISAIIYAYAAWSFFKSRIPYEENLLIRFYGDKYISYRKSSYIGIPFIKVIEISEKINKAENNNENDSSSNNNGETSENISFRH